MPPSAPTTTDHQILRLMSDHQASANAATMKITVAPMVPVRSALSGALPDALLTSTMPAMEHRIPTDANANGRNISFD